MATIRQGDRVKIIGEHPHTGEYGTWTGKVKYVDDASRDPMLEIDLEDCPDWTEGCYAYPVSLRLARR